MWNHPKDERPLDHPDAQKWFGDRVTSVLEVRALLPMPRIAEHPDAERFERMQGAEHVFKRVGMEHPLTDFDIADL